MKRSHQVDARAVQNLFGAGFQDRHVKIIGELVSASSSARVLD